MTTPTYRPDLAGQYLEWGAGERRGLGLIAFAWSLPGGGGVYDVTARTDGLGPHRQIIVQLPQGQGAEAVGADALELARAIAARRPTRRLAVTAQLQVLALALLAAEDPTPLLMADADTEAGGAP